MKNNILILVPKSEEKELLAEMHHTGVERGLIVRTSIGSELTKLITSMSKRGYFVNGIVFDESNNLEFMFQRHSKQTEQMKLAELKS